MKECKVVSTKRGKRCKCGNKFAKNSRCGLPSAKGRR